MKSSVDIATALVSGIAGESGPAIADGFPCRALQHPEPLNKTDVGLPADVERDLACVLARALVQQFRRDMALAADSCAPADADQVNAMHDRKADRREAGAATAPPLEPLSDGGFPLGN